MAYSYNNKGTKFIYDVDTWKKLSMWGTADNVEMDGSLFSNAYLPSTVRSAATVHAFLEKVNDFFGQANGFATLGADGKVPAGQLPSSVASGGMVFIGGANAGTDIETLMIAQIGATPAAADAGKYMIVTTGGELTNATGNSAHHTIQSGAGDEGDDTFPVTLEQGDWLVLLSVNEGTPLYTWGIIDNDYLEATSAAYGVVRLSDASTRVSLTGNDVITESVLATILGDDVLVDGDFATAGFMKTNGSGGYSVDSSTYITTALTELITGFVKAGSYAAVAATDSILSAIEQLAYTAETAYGWGDHSDAGYQSAITINSADPSGGADGDIWIKTS